MGRRSRLLPDMAYDFYAIDIRDGEEGPRRDTLRDAQRDAVKMRAPLERWRRFISVEWELNERKVLSLLDAPTKRAKGKQ